MTEPEFNSSLTEKEIEQNFEGTDPFSGIMSGLKEAIALKNEEKKYSLPLSLQNNKSRSIIFEERR